MKNYPIIPEDIRMYVDKFGKPEHEFPGKTLIQKTPRVNLDMLLRHRQVIVWADIFYVLGSCFLILVLTPTLFVFTFHLGGTGARGADPVLNKMTEAFRVMKSHRWITDCP